MSISSLLKWDQFLYFGLAHSDSVKKLPSLYRNTFHRILRIEFILAQAGYLENRIISYFRNPFEIRTIFNCPALIFSRYFAPLTVRDILDSYLEHTTVPACAEKNRGFEVTKESERTCVLFHWKYCYLQWFELFIARARGSWLFKVRCCIAELKIKFHDREKSGKVFTHISFRQFCTSGIIAKSQIDAVHSDDSFLDARYRRYFNLVTGISYFSHFDNVLGAEWNRNVENVDKFTMFSSDTWIVGVQASSTNQSPVRTTSCRRKYSRIGMNRGRKRMSSIRPARRRGPVINIDDLLNSVEKYGIAIKTSR